MTCNDVIRSFRKRNFLWDKDIVESMIRSRGLIWHLTKSFQKGERLNQKLKMKICKLGNECKKTSVLKRFTDGGLGPKPQLLGNFFAFVWKKSYFKCRWITFRMCSEPFETTRFLAFESQLKKIKLFQSSFYLYFGRKYVSDFGFGVKFCKYFSSK